MSNFSFQTCKVADTSFHDRQITKVMKKITRNFWKPKQNDFSTVFKQQKYALEEGKKQIKEEQEKRDLIVSFNLIKAVLGFIIMEIKKKKYGI